MRFKGKVVVVLGASAEGGTGWVTAEEFAAEGAKVIVASRSFERLQKLAKKIDGAAVACDASKETDVKALADFARKNFGKLDIAVNAAGLPVTGLISSIPHDQVIAAFETNYLANLYFVRHMAEAINENGSIVIITSMSTTHPVFPHFSYACAKAASDCLVRYAALEYAPRHIKVNSILPGPIMSEMGAQYLTLPGVQEAFIKEIPFGRVGYPKDFADAAMWLAGPSYVTGLNLQVNGGNHLGRFPRLDEFPDHGRGFDDAIPVHDRELAQSLNTGKN